MRKMLTVLVMALLLGPIFTFAQNSPAPDAKQFADGFDAQIRKTLERVPDIPGMAVVVIKDDKPIFVEAYGVADKENGKKADNDTLWYIASSNKAFTALAAAMLDREGKIRFSDPVTKYTSGITFKEPIPDKVTILDLFTHTSGLQNSPLAHRMAFTGQIDKREIAYTFANATTFSEENFGNYRYTNLGYNIYSILLENNLKVRWQDLLQKRIFDPAGMRHTTAVISRAPKRKWTVAAPYIFSDEAGGVIRALHVKSDDNMQAAGGMFMSISDLGRWLNLQMNDGRLDGKQVFPADLIRTSHAGLTKSTRNEPPFSGDGEYGLGWQIVKYRDEKVIYHHGGYAGYRSHVSFMPDRKVAVGILVNNDVAGGRVADALATFAYDWWEKRETADADYSKYLDELVRMYEERKKQRVADAASRAKRTSQLTRPLASYVGRYTNDLLGTFDVVEEGGNLAVRMGNMYSRATPFTEKDTIRVIMNISGGGDVIRFNLNGDRVESLSFSGVDFKRVP